MFYRITLDLAFEQQAPIEDILDKARDYLYEAVVINPNEPNEERGYIQLENCFHDEDPAKPCVVTNRLVVP